MKVGEILKNLATYWDIYDFVRRDEETFDSVKGYLMDECGKPESTARANLTGFRKSPFGLLLIDEKAETMCIDESKVREFLDALNDVFEFYEYDYSSEVINEYGDKICRLENLYNVSDNNYLAAHAENEDLKVKIKLLRDENQFLKDKLINALLNQPVLIAKSGFGMDESEITAVMGSYMKIRDTKESAMELLLQDEAILRKRTEKNQPGIIKRAITKMGDWLFAKLKKSHLRDAFARELLNQEWVVVADYEGKHQKFQLVPVEELEQLKEELQSTCGQSDHKLKSKTIL